MSSAKSNCKLPDDAVDQVYVTVSALEGGFLTLPESLFVADYEPGKRTTVPSLAFLIQHQTNGGRPERLVFDLGLKRDLAGYTVAQQHHITQRQPVQVSSDVQSNLKAGGLDPAVDIDTVIVSHVHWDHIGTPSDFSKSRFVVGSGTLHVLRHGAGPLYPAELFNDDEFPKERTHELPPARSCDASIASQQQTHHQWGPLASFPNAIDYWNDGSLYIIDTPGHITGHVNLLARVGKGRWVYMGGDCCHDTRILSGESEIALYDDGKGGQRSVHMDTHAARSSLDRIHNLINGIHGSEIETIIAHDLKWMQNNSHRFFPGTL